MSIERKLISEGIYSSFSDLFENEKESRDNSIVALIARLNKFMHDHPNHTNFRYELNSGEENVNLKIEAQRPETDKEYEKRLKRERKTRRA